MTKPVTSVAAMMLVEEGRMKLSDPITNWMPELRDLKAERRREGQEAEEVALDRPITVQDLLRHTSGFVYAESAPSERIKKLYEDGNIEARAGAITGDEMLKRLGAIPLAHQPGTHFHYSISTDVLGLLVERVAGPAPRPRVRRAHLRPPRDARHRLVRGARQARARRRGAGQRPAQGGHVARPTASSRTRRDAPT